MKMTKVKTKEQAISKAIDFQSWQATQNFSYTDVIDWANYFENMAREFDLAEEFLENGLI